MYDTDTTFSHDYYYADHSLAALRKITNNLGGFQLWTVMNVLLTDGQFLDKFIIGSRLERISIVRRNTF